MKDMNCGWIQAILAVVIIVFTIWPTSIFSATVSWWLVIISAVLLLWHAVSCKKCDKLCMPGTKGKGAEDTESKPKKRKK